MPTRKKLIIIGDAHDKNTSTDLLAAIVRQLKPAVLLEISKKMDVGRLFSFWTTPGTPEYEKRRAVLGALAFKYEKTYYPDMDYDSRYYLNDIIREDILSANIEKIMGFPEHDIGVLLIGYDHVYRLYQTLQKAFDIIILIPTDMDKNFYQKTAELVQTTGGFFFDVGTVTDVVKIADDFAHAPHEKFLSGNRGTTFGS